MKRHVMQVHLNEFEDEEEEVKKPSPPKNKKRLKNESLEGDKPKTKKDLPKLEPFEQMMKRRKTTRASKASNQDQPMEEVDLSSAGAFTVSNNFPLAPPNLGSTIQNPFLQSQTLLPSTDFNRF